MRDLLLQIDEGLGRRAGLEAALRERIRDGALPAGSPLPSSRALAVDLGMARATVVAAYEQLAIEGYVVSRHGAGTRVADVVPVSAEPVVSSTPSVGAPSSGPRPSFDADFRPGEPDGSMFPRAAWGAAIRRVLATTPDARLGYGHPWGEAELRSGVAAYLNRSRVVVAGSDDVRVTTGFGGGLASLARVLVRSGIDRVAVEDPSLFFTRGTIRRSGAAVVPVSVDDDGLDVEALRRSGARAVVVTPAHQYPTGAILAPERRAALVAWAHEVDGWIIEDDYDGEFRYDRQTIGALQGLEPDRVIYTGTVSKMLVPAVRLGWMVVPAVLRRAVDGERAMLATPSVLDQLTFADLLERGEVERHLRRARTTYRRRRRRTAAALAGIGGLVVPDVDAGLHLLVGLPTAVDESALVARAGAAGLGLLGLGPHWDDPTGRPPALVLGTTRVPEHAFEDAIGTLVERLRAELAI